MASGDLMAMPTAALRMGWRKRTFPAAAGFFLLLVAAVVHFFQPLSLQSFGNLLFDHYQRTAPRPYEDVYVRVVDIDEESLRRFGQWAWPRPLIADMTQRLADAGAGVIAFDIVFSEPDRTSPENLGPILERGGAGAEVIESLRDYEPHDVSIGRTFSTLPVIMGYFLEQMEGKTDPLRRVGVVTLGDDPTGTLPTYRSATTSLEVIESQALDAGFVSIQKDADGVIRAAPMLAVMKDEIYPSLSLAVLRFIAEAMGENAGAYVLKTSTASRQYGARSSDIVSIKVGGFEIPTTPDGAVWMKYTASKENRMVPAWKVLDPNTTDAELRELFEGTIVFVGTGAQGLRDLVPTPVDPALPGVLVHAQALEQMLLGDFIQRPDWAPGVRMIAMLAGGLILILIVPIAGPLRSGLVGAVIVGGLFWLSWFLYDERSLLFDPVYPALALLVVYGSTSLVSFVVTEAEKSYIKDAFDRYLSPEMVEKLADDPSQLALGGQEREMTILFSDIRSFSKISEGMTPEELTTYLNTYLTPMTDILMSHKATVDKYIGDAVMSFWNAPLDDPDQYKNAARSALAMMEKLDAMNAARGRDDAQPGEALPVKTAIGIGLHSGLTSVGNMGSEQRFAYSVLGDTVNTASRLEGMTKQYGVGILVGDETARHLDGFATFEVDRAKAVGKDEWLTIFVLVGDETVGGDPRFVQLRERQGEFLEAYRQQDFDKALTLADECILLGKHFGLQRYYGIMKDRIEGYRSDPPPPHWDGVYVFSSK